MNRKGFNPAILMGASAIFANVFLKGVPFGGGVSAIIAGILFSVSALLIFAAGFFFKNAWKLDMAAFAAIAVNYMVSTLAEGLCEKPFMLALGWAMALLFSAAGIIMSVRNRKEHRIILSIIVNSVMALTSVIVLTATLVSYKGLVIIPSFPQK